MKDITVTFPGGKRVDAHYDGRTVCTDQSVGNGGDGSAPEPFDLFFVSLVTCVGIYALEFCTARKLNTDGLGVRLLSDWDPEKRRYDKISIQVTVPEDFPEKYTRSLLRAADMCTVKRHIIKAPEFELTLSRQDQGKQDPS